MKNTSSFSKYKSRKSKPKLNFWGDRTGPKVIHTFTSQWLVSMHSHKAPAIPIKPVTPLYPEARQQVKERTCMAWFLTEDFKGLSNISCKEKSHYQNYFSEQLFFSPFSSLFTHTHLTYRFCNCEHHLWGPLFALFGKEFHSPNLSCHRKVRVYNISILSMQFFSSF